MNNQNFDPFKQEEPQSPAGGGNYFAPQQDPAPQQGGYYYQPPQQPKKPTPGMATASLVMGILSLVCCGSMLFSILAVIFSFMAPKNEQGTMYGAAKAGMICGAIGLVFSVIYIAYLVIVLLSGAGGSLYI